MDHQAVTDSAVVAGAVSSPVWIEYVQSGLGVYMLIGGAILLAIRIYIAVLDLKKRRETREEC